MIENRQNIPNKLEHDDTRLLSQVYVHVQRGSIDTLSPVCHTVIVFKKWNQRNSIRKEIESTLLGQPGWETQRTLADLRQNTSIISENLK